MLSVRNKAFDPYVGAYSPELYGESDLPYYNALAAEAYTLAGYDLETITALGLNNPMSDDDWLNAGVPIEYIYSRGGLSSHGPYYFFVKEMKLNMEYGNFEANYLDAMMDAHPQQLSNAKEAYYQALVDRHGSAEAIFEWLAINKEVLGPLDIPDS